MELTKKQRAYIEYTVENPLLPDLQCAKNLNISAKQICKGKKNPEFKAEIKKLLDEQWEDARKVAQQTMYNLAASGDYRAAEFLMKTNGITATEKVDVSADVNVIKVDVVDD